ncbi:hypothetical protein DL93DRAFT_2082201 [Clavulina sp. PMI_390]|nr:hypothetical protein DL93DRAFT_2082201 [Clavulina sp. PMI_390]
MKQATGFLRKASIFRKSQLPQAVTPAPVKEAPEAKQDEIQGTFAGLPDEVHIAILCEGLEPRDLIAVSHVRYSAAFMRAYYTHTRHQDVPSSPYLRIVEYRVALCMASIT